MLEIVAQVRGNVKNRVFVEGEVSVCVAPRLSGPAPRPMLKKIFSRAN